MTSHRTGIVLSIGAAGALWVAVSAQQQEMKPRPGPGSGITHVTGDVRVAGEVEVTNTPTVRSTQQGEWRVAVQNGVRITDLPSPAFLRAGVRYAITWGDGQTETVRVERSAGSGWIEVEAGRRWVNVSAARAIREVR